MPDHRLSRVAFFFIESVVRSRDNEYAVGDFVEIYESLIEEKGTAAAHRWLWKEALRSLPGFFKISINWNVTMIKNYLKTSLRNMARNRIFAAINLLGMAVGMACFILIMFWTQNELGYDKFHENKDRLYLLTIRHPSGIEDSNVPYALAPVLAEERPEIAEYTRVYRLGPKMTCSFMAQSPSGDTIKAYEKEVIMVDPAFFTMFSFPFTFGNPSTSLINPSSVVISEEAAVRYFGHGDPLGKKLNFNGRRDLIVSGVVRVPESSSLSFDFATALGDPWRDNWNWADPSYILLVEAAPVEAFRTKIAGALMEHYPGNLGGEFKVEIIPFDKTHLHFGRMTYVRIFALIAAFILLIACVNYMNLSTARSSSRGHEVGIRKVVGARRLHLIHQFLGESVLMSGMALVLALILVKALLPVLNGIAGKSLQFSLLQPPWMIPLLLILVVVVGVVAGIYPSLFLSSSDPARVMKSAQPFRSRRSLFREGSVVGQFTISVLLIICTLVVSRQLGYIRNRPLGFQTDYVISMPFNNDLKRRYTSFRNELLREPGVLSVTACQAAPYNADYKTQGIQWMGKDPEFVASFRYNISDFTYFETFGIETVQGRTFSRKFPTDRTNFVVNEDAVQYMGMKDPIGQPLSMWGNRGTIIGVVKDFHHVSLHREIMPQVFTINPRLYDSLQYVFIKISSNNVPEILGAIRRTTDKFAPAFPFDYEFLDEGIDNLYRSEQRLGRIFGNFAFLAMFISCLGIFGLSAFAVERRTKEIGIRKVLGATTPGIMVLTSREFLKWLVVANIVAWPIAWFAMNKWLQKFAYRTGINPVWFLLAGLLSVSIAFIPVIYHTGRAALSNPVDSLRYE